MVYPLARRCGQIKINVPAHVAAHRDKMFTSSSFCLVILYLVKSYFDTLGLSIIKSLTISTYTRAII